MDKLKTKILLISLLLVLLVSLQGVSATTDDNGNLTSESIDLSICDNTDDANPDKLSTADTSNGQEEVLSTTPTPFSELYKEIATGGKYIELKHDYYAYEEGDITIEIYDDIVIDGKGAVIDMAESNIMAFYINSHYGVTIKNLTIKNVNYDGKGGAIYFYESSYVNITCCNFINNTASDGGAIYFERNCHMNAVTNCNFADNKATGSGGAIYIDDSASVENCNFTNNIASGYAGAINIGEGSFENCNFINNSANYGGAIRFSSKGTVTNCSFTDNSADYGGAIFAPQASVENCNFTVNTANIQGGAIYMGTCSVENCNFTDNTASGDGGAIFFTYDGNVTNCNFTGNNAINGSAIYFWSTITTGNVSNSCFLNNRANAEELQVTKNENNITITFTGNDNLLNAIYSEGDVTFTNVFYWGVEGITNTGSSAIKPSRSNREAGQNITLEIYDSDSLVDNVTLVTDDNGQVSYDFSKLSDGRYRYKAYHLDDSYYTYSEKNDTFTKGVGDFNLLQSYINVAKTGSELTLYRNYTFTIGLDENLIDGIVIDKPITINGNGFTINALQKARIFNVTAENVVLNNITFTNATTSGNGGAVYFSNSGNVTNCNFTANQASVDGGAVYFWDDGTVTNCNFTNNNAEDYGGAIWMSSGSVTNCNFTNNQATGSNSRGGAIYMYSGSVENCNFTNNTASRDGGAIWISSGSVENCNFTANQASVDGGAVYFNWEGTVTNCNFTNNNAEDYGGAVYFDEEGTVTNCNFTGNNATTGSAIYFWSTSATKTVSNSCFLNNRANAETLEVTKNDNNITITFTGNDNLLNAIYSRNDAEVTFSNVTYWGANGIAKTGSSAIKPSRSNKEAGQNITVSILVNDKIVLSEVYLTNENGTIVLDIKAGDNYFIGVRHDTDSYYTEKVNTTSNNTKFHVNVTSQTTNNKTVNITAKSNIPDEVIAGKLLFIVPKSDPINATYVGNGTWWAVHTFDDYGVHEVNASYTGLDNVTINNGTVTISDVRLSVVKSANVTEVAYNSLVQFTINVTNYGFSNATGVEVSDCLPRGLTFIEAGVINSTGQYEVFDSPDLLILIDGEDHATFNEFSSSGAIEYDIAQWSITRIASGNSVILLITARANGLAMGNLTNEVSVSYNENKTDSIVNSTNITVVQANSSVSAADVEVTYGQSIVVVVSSENATKISYQVIGVDGVVKEGSINVGENITGLDLAAGEYTVNLTTVVNANYTSSSYTSKITVNRANSSISAADVKITYGETAIIPVSVVNASEFYYAVVNEKGVTVDSDIIQAGLNITVRNLSAGKYNVTLITGVDSNHTSLSNGSRITVNQASSSVSAEDIVASFGDAVSIPVSSLNATGISYTITDANNKAVANGTVKPGEAIIVSDLAAGNYTVNLTTVVDANHTSESNSSKLHIKHVVSIYIAPLTGLAGEVFNFTAQFKYENGDLVNEGAAGLTIKYEEREVLAASRYSLLSADESVPVSNGQATFNVKLGDSGRYPYVISYSGGDVDDVQAESTLTILKVSTTVSGMDISGKPSDKKDITVTVLDQDKNPVANGTVALTLNGKTYNATVENGKATVSVVLPNPGNYEASVKYNGNDHYNSSTSSINVNVKKENTKAPSVKNVVGKAGAKTDIPVKIVDEKGNPVQNGTVTLTIDGKTYTAEVINGVATFKDVVLPDEDTVADVYYQGNDYYNASSTTISIKVKHDGNNTDENKTAKNASSEIVEANATGNPIAMMLAALFVMVITYRKK